MPLTYVREQGKNGNIGAELIAVVAEGDRRRHYVRADEIQRVAAHVDRPLDGPDSDLPTAALGFRVQAYGMRQHSDLFGARQLVALTTFSDLVGEARVQILQDLAKAGDSRSIEYADAVAIYLAFAVDKGANLWSSLASWMSDRGAFRETFARQAVPMVWDYAEANPLGSAGGGFVMGLEKVAMAVAACGVSGTPGFVSQVDAMTRSYRGVLVATDPPYYDNVGYADLSDYFYVWLRRSLSGVEPDLLGTVLTPKAQELVAEPFRHGGSDSAERFFESGFASVFSRIRREARGDLPITVFYAFKQSDAEEEGTASTGWQTLLTGMLRGGWEVTGTWPVRTESPGRVRAFDANALASSVVLALRARPADAETISRRSFVQALKVELPSRLRQLQQGSIAPVDLAQAAIGPGMAVFSRHARVLEADGSDMTVRTALALINQALDEVLAEQEGDFDAETRFAVKWFSQYGWNEAPSGEADVLTRAVNTTVSVLERGGIFRAAAGKARLLEPGEMSAGWNPAEDKAISVWEVAVRLGHALMTEGLDQAAVWMRESASRVDLDAVKELAYLMYSVCERKGWTDAAMLFNALGTSWGDVSGAARAAVPATASQGALDLDVER